MLAVNARRVQEWLGLGPGDSPGTPSTPLQPAAPFSPADADSSRHPFSPLKGSPFTPARSPFSSPLVQGGSLNLNDHQGVKRRSADLGGLDRDDSAWQRPRAGEPSGEETDLDDYD